MTQTVNSQAEVLQLLKSKSLVHTGAPITIDTIINGVKEVSNVANDGDYILTGVHGEEYVVTPPTFAKRYTIEDDKAVAKGECWGFPYSGKSFIFISPWKDKDGHEEEMICNNGDMLVSPNPQLSEVYRIEKDAFAKTYQPA